MRVVIRDAEWRIHRADDSGDGGHLLTCDGVSIPHNRAIHI